MSRVPADFTLRRKLGLTNRQPLTATTNRGGIGYAMPQNRPPGVLIRVALKVVGP